MDPWVLITIVVVGVFGLCFLVDKGFTKIFRGKAQHATGLSVRLNKRYGTFGIVLTAVGVAAFFAGFSSYLILVACGPIVSLMGIGLIVYYMSFGIYYDEDSFILSKFGKPSITYYFKDIRSQQLYLASGNVVVELHMADGSHFQVHTGMTGMDTFMDDAFAAWLQLTGRTREDCPWYDVENSCWFPPYAV